MTDGASRTRGRPVRVRGFQGTSSTILLATTLLIAFPVVADGGRESGRAPELWLFSGGSSVAVDQDSALRLAAAVTDFFESCRRYADVVLGERPSREEWDATWEKERRGTHFLLRTTGTSDSRHVSLRGKRFTLLLGLEPGQGPWPVLTRDADGTVTTYTKCDGLTGLLLSCKLDGLIPGRNPAPDCHRLRQLRR